MSGRIPIAVAIIGTVLFQPLAFTAQRRTGSITDSAPVYLLPDSSRTPLATLKRGEQVEVLEVQREWVKVEFQDPSFGRRVGYAAASLVTFTAVPEASAAPASTPQQPALSATSPPARAPAVQSGKIAIYVRSGSTANGFTDPSKDRGDSVRDLVNHLRNSKSLRPVDTEVDAIVLLEVLERETKREANGWTFVSGAKQNKSYVTVRLSVGDYSTEFTGESNSRGVMKGYGNAAKKVVEQLDAWVNANRERLATVAPASR